MQFLISVILSDIEASTPFLNEHLAYLKHYLNNGNFLTYGPYLKTHGGWILAQSDSTDTLTALLSEDPLARHNLAQYDIQETAVANISPLLKK